MARPKIKNRAFIKKPLYVKLPAWLIFWMRSKKTANSRLIEDAVKAYYKDFGGNKEVY